MSIGISKQYFMYELKPALQLANMHADNVIKKRETSRLSRDRNLRRLSAGTQRVLGYIFMVLEFLFEGNHASDYRMVLTDRKRISLDENSTRMEEWKYRLAFWCLNLAAIFRQLSNDAHCMDTFASELGTKFPIRLEAKHVIGPQRVCIRAGKTFHNRWQATGTLAEIKKVKKVIIESKGASVEKLDYSVTNDGIDFPDHLCRAIVSIGIPYSSLKDTNMIEKRKYNDVRKLRGDNIFVASSGIYLMHSGTQKHWGAIILLDSRFTQESNVNRLSKWVRDMFVARENFNEFTYDLREFMEAQQSRKQSKVDDELTISAADTQHEGTPNAQTQGDVFSTDQDFISLLETPASMTPIASQNSEIVCTPPSYTAYGSHVRCKTCGMPVMHVVGEKKDVLRVSETSSEYIQSLMNDADSRSVQIYEIARPSKWKADNLAGGPIDCDLLPRITSVFWDRVDVLGFRPLL
ncbi:hypothetical protein VTP01DRAFT_266 [Rhizomucor pusillus]|uniref:uncharacterized protein n=1 Tax=Rhizomucor pusillus TaxID=4840 RepID=UPI0037426FC8